MEFLFSFEGLTALVTLTFLEIVLGIDNIIFVSILVTKLPKAQQGSARTVGLTLALVLRLAFLFVATWVAGLTEPVLSFPAILGMAVEHNVSWRDVIMLVGGLFLLTKATSELHRKIEGPEDAVTGSSGKTYGLLIMQIIILDVVFSIDSVIMAVGLSDNIMIMSIAVIIAVIVMQISSKPITHFIEQYPTIKILALAFLLMVGLVLVTDGFHVHVPRGYVYFAMLFSVAVEYLNHLFRVKRAKHLS